MLLIYRKETDPYFNIAAEEYLLKSFREDIFSVWIDDPCVVVGKHQNTLAEINYRYLKENDIPVLRRITGGGAVYHDHGNLNYSFATSGEPGKMVDFRKFTLPIIQFLDGLGVRAEFEGMNNLVVNNLKISGNSAHVYRNRVIHHGTILHSSDLKRLNFALTGTTRYGDKSVKSTRARVTNISGYMTPDLPIGEFAQSFFHFMMNKLPDCSIYQLDDEDNRHISKLMEEKYRKWEWTYGYSPDYILDNQYEKDGFHWQVRIEVSKGIIRQCSVRISSGIKTIKALNILTGIPHEEQAVREMLGNINFAKHQASFDKELFLEHIF